MTYLKTTYAAAVAVAAFSGPAWAGDGGFQLPEACTAGLAVDAMDHAAMDDHGMHGDHGDPGGHGDHADQFGSGMMGLDPATMPEHVRENMRKMRVTMPAMHLGMMNHDPDLAFVCGMIAHHQGAIDMAQVLLEHGEDPQMRALAEEIIEAQADEIDDMTRWLGQRDD